jgi:NAD(P) transhydrogenase subunit beta
LNALFVEVEIPYNVAFEIKKINKDFHETDVILIFGANYIVNSSAIEDPNSPIAVMLVL